MARACISLTHRCSNACRFCAQAGHDADRVDPRLELERARQEHDAVTFVGGDPTSSEQLEALVQRAQELGFSTIGLQTNGHDLAHRLADLRDRGLTDLHLSLHGHDSTLHDHHTGREGSHADLVEAAREARALGLPFVVCTVITRSNFRVVSQIADQVRGLGAAAWLCEFLAVAGRAGPNLDALLPRLAMVLPHVLHATHQSRTRGLPSLVRGAPACLMGPYASHLLPASHCVHAPICRTCPAARDCSGVDPVYLRRFGAGELHHREAFEPADPPPLADAFVGIGPQVDPDLPDHLKSSTPLPVV